MARNHRSDGYHFSLILENISDLAETQIIPLKYHPQMPIFNMGKK